MSARRRQGKPLAIFKAGSTWPEMAHKRGDFEDWLRRGLGSAASHTEVVAVAEGAPPPAPEDLAGVIITGSHAMVTDREPWSEGLADWLREAVPAGLPVLGICYGHQLLAHALGGEVGDLEPLPEIGTIPVRLTAAGREDHLFAGLPAQFCAHASHYQTALRLPPNAVHLAGNQREPHHAFRVGRRAWGVQFHPELDAHSMRAYVRRWTTKADAPPQDWDGIHDAVRETPEAARILTRFAEVVFETGD